MADVGYGTTVQVNTTTQTAVRSVTWGGMDRAIVETTHMTTSTAKTFIPSDIYDPGTLDFTLDLVISAIPGIGDAAATTTIDWAGGGTTWAASAFMNSASQAAEIEEIMEGEHSFKFTATITVT